MLVSLKKKYPDEFSEDGYDRFILLKSDDLDIKMTGKERIIHSSETDELKKAFEDNFFGLAVDENGYILFKEVEIS